MSADFAYAIKNELQLSKLHLFLKNITESPLCRCGSIDNTEHFFLYCRFHQAQRDELISVITPYQAPTTNLFLYGDENLSEQTNKLLFESVQTFVIGIKHFKPRIIMHHFILKLLHMHDTRWIGSDHNF